MGRKIAKRREKELSARQAKYVAMRETGAPRQQSAIFAGYADVDKAGEQVELSPLVQDELAKARTQVMQHLGKTKEDIAEMLMDAYATAKVMADPSAMVRAAAELGKMLGLYAPEVKKVEHGLNAHDRRLIEKMTDEDLYRLARGKIIEGEATEVKDVANSPE